jgi:glycerophosphoryl diester phosphodiesterase
MQIISHRGYWKRETEKNRPVAFERSFELGFGTETDLRDREGDIVISHDMADENAISLQNLLEIHQTNNASLPLALNIKADGLYQKLKEALQEFSLQNYFVFDMSIPDTIGYINHKINFFSRQSEYEPQPAFYEKCTGIWLDAFNGNWYNTTIINNHVKQGKKVAIVSPDLHKREVYTLWEELKKNNIHTTEEVILCTDKPEEAIFFFK